MIWSELTSFMLCCSSVRRRLRCILWLGPMWQYWTTRILPMLSTGRWQILMLLIQGTTILRNVSCSYAARVLALPDLLTCLRSSVVRIIVTNPSKSVEVRVPFGPSAAAVCIWYWFFILLYATWCRCWSIECFTNTFLCYCENFLWIWIYSVYCGTQFIIVLISSYRYILMDYTFCACQIEKR